eukprot:TRINITY_DN44440_c0_g2_i1.p1 TRINITY_DN44440_c0_g2~~TRINITY_DN44440_c0_g2_i1.p1  ORF type:complete len:293 (-),score=8.98 TRINITY_DN44440_c0_g2_i1:72-950(-)
MACMTSTLVLLILKNTLDSKLRGMEARREPCSCANLKSFSLPEAPEEPASGREKLLRLAQEQGSLRASMPLNLESSVFLRISKTRVDVMQAMITGPRDTPYAGGCFQFDIFFPSTYPNTPPLVNLETTGGCTVRFNPNLYDTGKVCLSLLGTWSGTSGENWSKETSTFLQVLISIQSLILVPQPYYNEPGYERQMGTPAGDSASAAYNDHIRCETIHWTMLEMLRKPPAGFEEVVRAHFYLKQKEILTQCDKWVKESTGYRGPMETYVKDLRLEIAKLTPPKEPKENPFPKT